MTTELTQQEKIVIERLRNDEKLVLKKENIEQMGLTLLKAGTIDKLETAGLIRAMSVGSDETSFRLTEAGKKIKTYSI